MQRVVIGLIILVGTGVPAIQERLAAQANGRVTKRPNPTAAGGPRRIELASNSQVYHCKAGRVHGTDSQAKDVCRLRAGDSHILRLLAIAILIFIAFSFLLPGKFFTIRNMQSMAVQFPEFGILAFAILITMLTGGIDLSIVGTANLSAIFAPDTGAAWRGLARGLARCDPRWRSWPRRLWDRCAAS